MILISLFLNDSFELTSVSTSTTLNTFSLINLELLLDYTANSVNGTFLGTK